MNLITTTLMMLTIATASQAVAAPAGLRLTSIDMPHHDKEASATIWYPNGGGGDMTIFAENPVFQGVDAAMNAEVRDGVYPVVLFSHGMGGTARAQAWLAAGLAERGAIVVSVNHAYSTWGDFNMTKGVRHWTRALDMSEALDALLDDPDFGGRIDPSRVMAAGFSYGGWTALSLGGLRGNHTGIVGACTNFIETMEACDLLLSDAVNMQGLEAVDWNASYADARITHVAAIDPGFVWGLTAENAATLIPNVLLIGFGGAEDRMQATDFDQSGMASLLSDAQILRFDPSFHFTAMPLCKPEGEAILIEENDDPVCTDPAGTDRSSVHDDIIDAMAEQLGL
ncbi:dienelactone hydrolase [Pseudovibrio japonicus]|uniref:Dienelactone hydrolase n=1 Tax=Pseudovibrio japonicus TaxID=366534 RepID=A0ABQ3EN80_9HYPH|nr:hypothetical protein [Pseudovibrio japonicus]GHB42256.1 dienelactone hydrolase [Pseudovibrio japonicus]